MCSNGYCPASDLAKREYLHMCCRNWSSPVIAEAEGHWGEGYSDSCTLTLLKAYRSSAGDVCVAVRLLKRDASSLMTGNFI